ncbi:MAG: LytTR family transcriptional regulator DNA-binding domain-containing protein [Lewinella sp.]|nr:LytTR family transcriptional regulator DNA-binding domain-containing protein [Lewinella sp.]
MKRAHTEVNDSWMFLFLYPMMAVAIIFIGNDNSLRKLLSIPSFYTDLLVAIACTYLAGWYFRVLFRRLERDFDWDTQLRQRLRRQLVLGVLLPTAVLVAIEVAYLFLAGIVWAKSSVFYLELPIIILFCTIVNLVYFFLYYRQHQLTRQQAMATAPEAIFVAGAGKRIEHIPQSDVAYFITREKVTFLVTTGGRRHVYEATLKQLGEDLPNHHFFQLNRQVIATRQGIASSQRTATRRLEISLRPAADEPVFVAKTKVTAFLDWLSGGGLSA